MWTPHRGRTERKQVAVLSQGATTRLRLNTIQRVSSLPLPLPIPSALGGLMAAPGIPMLLLASAEPFHRTPQAFSRSQPPFQLSRG